MNHLPEGYVITVECTDVIDGDQGEYQLEVGDSVYPLRCDFDGEVAAECDYVVRMLVWVCPRCGSRHQDPMLDPEDYSGPFEPF